MPEAVITVVSRELCHQFTQERHQPRHIMFKWALTPITGGIDLLSMSMADHRVWRTRLNPAFSNRNLFAHNHAILEEVSVFVEQLKREAGSDRTWGRICTLHERAFSLTCVIIMRLVLGMRAQEQLHGPRTRTTAFRNLTKHAKTRNLASILQRPSPRYLPARRGARRRGHPRDPRAPDSRALSLASPEDQRTVVVDFALRDVEALRRRGGSPC
ncbi:hypothetical protein F4780DRAFT_744429 [Xylariomycetidae sp. FL0641]|nr:hypothetical protein F4780DRAFT_744429 [Xylariomycetidae sp. FL0641]